MTFVTFFILQQTFLVTLSLWANKKGLSFCISIWTHSVCKEFKLLVYMSRTGSIFSLSANILIIKKTLSASLQKRDLLRTDYNKLHYVSLGWQITFQKADSGFWDFLHQMTHEELTTKIFCTNEGTIFQEPYLIRSEFYPFWNEKAHNRMITAV